MGEAPNLIGSTFGKWSVLSLHHTDKKSGQFWLCRCECGETRPVSTNRLNSGSKSCGCAKKSGKGHNLYKHGLSGRPEYRNWMSMKSRCAYPKAASWRNYGANGITVCDRWRNSFEAFLEDMGEKPSPDHTIDRIDASLGYSPENCRWATKREQNNNRRDNRRVTLNGESLTIAEAARATGIPYGTIRHRLNSGKSDQEALAHV